MIRFQRPICEVICWFGTRWKSWGESSAGVFPYVFDFAQTVSELVVFRAIFRTKPVVGTAVPKHGFGDSTHKSPL